MKFLFIAGFLFAISLLGTEDLYGQEDSVTANSCRHISPGILYSYTVSTQTHDYSGNWDFDGDGEADSLYFIGTGGAHLYFYLRIILSSDGKTRNFPFLRLDMPCAGSVDELKKARFYPPPFFPFFVVDKFISGEAMGDTNDKIYMHLDFQTASLLPGKWKKRGVNSAYLLLQYEKGDMTIKNFIN